MVIYSEIWISEGSSVRKIKSEKEGDKERETEEIKIFIAIEVSKDVGAEVPLTRAVFT